LVSELIDDVRWLFHQEIALAKAEIQQGLAQMGRGLAFVSGGGLLLYAALLFIVMSVPLLLWAFTTMPFWLAALLAGILLMVWGWLMTLWGRRQLAHQLTMPKQTLETLREDVDVIKEHLAS
jgi:uncharacterized membrane protein YqjE